MNIWTDLHLLIINSHKWRTTKILVSCLSSCFSKVFNKFIAKTLHHWSAGTSLKSNLKSDKAWIVWSMQLDCTSWGLANWRSDSACSCPRQRSRPRNHRYDVELDDYEEFDGLIMSDLNSSVVMLQRPRPHLRRLWEISTVFLAPQWQSQLDNLTRWLSKYVWHILTRHATILCGLPSGRDSFLSSDHIRSVHICPLVKRSLNGFT